MSAETCRKIKAVLLITVLAIAEAQKVQQYVSSQNGRTWQLGGFTSSSVDDSDLRGIEADPTLVTKQMEKTMADPSLQQQAKVISEQIEGMMAIPKLQEQTKIITKNMEAMLRDQDLRMQGKTFTDQLKAIMADPNLQKQVNLVDEQMKVMTADPNFQKHAKHIDQMEATMAGLSSQEQVKLVSEQMKAMKADPKFQEQAKGIAGQIKAMKADPNLQKQVRRVTEQMEAMKADLNFREHVKSIAVQMEGVLADTNLQRQAMSVAEQMEVTIARLKLKEQTKHNTDQMKGMRARSDFREHNRVTKQTTSVQDSTDASVDNLFDKVLNKLLDRAHTAWTLQHTDLDDTTLDKGVSHLAGPGADALQLRGVPSYSQYTFPTRSLPTARLRLKPFNSFVNQASKPFLQPPRLSSISAQAQTHKSSGDEEHYRLIPQPVQPHGPLTLVKKVLSPRVLASVAIMFAVMGSAQPALASALTDKIALSGDSSGFVQAFLLIFLSEIGDKTFFIAGLLAAKYDRITAFSGSIGALAAMTVIATLIGQIFHNIPEGLTQGLPLDDYAAVAAFTYFGFKTLYDAYSTEGKIDEERQDAEEVVAEETKDGRSEFVANLLKTFGLVFVAEIGDRSFLSTIALSAALNPFAVTVGAVIAHAFATGVAVIGGDLLSEYLSEKVIGYIGGTLFLAFAVTTAIGVF